ncbi:MAG: hypothetical protein ACLR8P_05460 [Clostridium fessum]
MEEFSNQMEQASDVTASWEEMLSGILRRSHLRVDNMLVLQYEIAEAVHPSPPSARASHGGAGSGELPVTAIADPLSTKDNGLFALHATRPLNTGRKMKPDGDGPLQRCKPGRMMVQACAGHTILTDLPDGRWCYPARGPRKPAEKRSVGRKEGLDDQLYGDGFSTSAQHQPSQVPTAAARANQRRNPAAIRSRDECTKRETGAVPKDRSRYSLGREITAPVPSLAWLRYEIMQAAGTGFTVRHRSGPRKKSFTDKQPTFSKRCGDAKRAFRQFLNPTSAPFHKNYSKNPRHQKLDQCRDGPTCWSDNL